MSAMLVRETHAAYQRLRRFVPLGVLRSEKDYRKTMAMFDEIIMTSAKTKPILWPIWLKR